MLESEVFLFMRLVYSRWAWIDRARGPLGQLADLDGDPLLQALGLLVEHVRALVGCVLAVAEQDLGLKVVATYQLQW